MKLDRPLKHQLAGGTAALAATLPIVAGAGPLIAIVSALSLTGGLGYTLASFLLSSWCRSSERRLNDVQAQFAEYQEMERIRLKAERKVIAAEGERLKAEIYKAREVARLAESVLKAQYDAEIQAAKVQLKASFDQGLQDRITRLEAEKVARVKYFRSQHLQQERELKAEILDLRQQLDQKTAFLKEEFDKAIPIYKRNYHEVDQAIAAQRGLGGEAKAEAKAPEQLLQEQIQQLQIEIAQLKAPKRYRRYTDNDLLGNRILDFFKERGVPLEGEDWAERFNHVDFYLWPLPGVQCQVVSALLDDLQIYLDIGTKPTAVVEHNFIKLGIQVATHSPAWITEAERASKQVIQAVNAQESQVTTAPAIALSDTASDTDLETLLAEGTHCPACGYHSARYSKRKPNTRGKVSVKCINPACTRKTFQWKVV